MEVAANVAENVYAFHNVIADRGDVHFGESPLGSYAACEGKHRPQAYDEFCRLQPTDHYMQTEEKNVRFEDMPAPQEPKVPRARANEEPEVRREQETKRQAGKSSFTDKI